MGTKFHRGMIRILPEDPSRRMGGVRILESRSVPQKLRDGFTEPVASSNRRQLRHDVHRRRPSSANPPGAALHPMPTNGCLSVLIPAYKTPALVHDAIISILKQEVPRGWELEILIGVDGCEETLSSLQAATYDGRVRVVEFESNRGPYQVLNALLLLSRGDPIMILDSDDWMLPGRIVEQLEALKEADIVGSLYEISDNGTITLGPITQSHPTLHSPTRHYPVHSSWSVRRHVFERLGGYQGWRCGADWEFLTRAFACGYNVCTVQKALFVRRRRPGQLTALGTTTGPGTPLRQRAHDYIQQAIAGYQKGEEPKPLAPILSRSSKIKKNHRITVGVVLPTIPSRSESAGQVVRSLLVQGVEEIIVHLQGYEKIPEWSLDDRVQVLLNPAGMGPLVRWSSLPKTDVILGLDDDIRLPYDYVQKTVEHLLRLGRGNVLTYHGTHWDESHAYEDRKVLHYRDKSDRFEPKSYMGCGVSAFFAEDLAKIERCAPEMFSHQDDVWISAAVARSGLKIYRPPTPQRWIDSPPGNSDGIYENDRKDHFTRRKAAIAAAIRLGGWSLTPKHKALGSR